MALELIHCPDACLWQTLLYLEDLSVVGRDDEDVVECQLVLVAITINPAWFAGKDVVYELRRGIGFLDGETLIAGVGDRQVTKPASADRPFGYDLLLRTIIFCMELVVVEQL